MLDVTLQLTKAERAYVFLKDEEGTLRHFMAHLSLTQGAPTWGDHVTDPEYRGKA